MAYLFKQAPITFETVLKGGRRVKPWSKVVELGGADDADKRQPAPLAPSAFRELLAGLSFTNGADRDIVGSLYESTICDGLGGLVALEYGHLGWDDAQAHALSTTLREVSCPRVASLDLSGNAFQSADALAGISELAALQVLSLSGNSALTALPDSLGKLGKLHTLDIGNKSQRVGCASLKALPDSIGALTALQYLDLTGCRSLAALPDTIGQCVALMVIILTQCSRMAELPTSLVQCKALELLDLTRCPAIPPPELWALRKLEIVGTSHGSDEGEESSGEASGEASGEEGGDEVGEEGGVAAQRRRRRRRRRRRVRQA
jgi:hypothetical protein